jgi:DNA-binding transcriptional LysR family regulator
MTHPTVRRRLEDMERALGVVLFTRSPDGLKPTAAALKLKPAAILMENAAASLQRSASAGESTTGVAKIACGELTAQELLPLVACELGARHPRPGLEVAMGNPSIGVLRGDAAGGRRRPSARALGRNP